MILKRTDGGGTSYDTQRLILLRDFINYFEINFINELHDHKGILTVHWYGYPSDEHKDLIKGFWSALIEEEVDHVVKEDIDLIYYELFIKLKSKYKDAIFLNEEGKILIDESANLFNYTDYEFFGKFMEDFESYRIVNSFYDSLYLEWNDQCTQIIYAS